MWHKAGEYSSLARHNAEQPSLCGIIATTSRSSGLAWHVRGLRHSSYDYPLDVKDQRRSAGPWTVLRALFLLARQDVDRPVSSLQLTTMPFQDQSGHTRKDVVSAKSAGTGCLPRGHDVAAFEAVKACMHHLRSLTEARSQQRVCAERTGKLQFWSSRQFCLSGLWRTGPSSWTGAEHHYCGCKVKFDDRDLSGKSR